MAQIDQVNCRQCGGPTRVVDSREVQIGWAKTIRRRRACMNRHCKAAHNTAEIFLDIAKDVFDEEGEPIPTTDSPGQEPG